MESASAAQDRLIKDLIQYGYIGAAESLFESGRVLSSGEIAEIGAAVMAGEESAVEWLVSGKPRKRAAEANAVPAAVLGGGALQMARGTAMMRVVAR